jgi:hypothetical protein
MIQCTVTNNPTSATLPPELVTPGEDQVPSILIETGQLLISDSILWDGNQPVTTLTNNNLVWMTYTNISGDLDDLDPNWLGLGNISVDPAFAMTGYGPQDINQPYMSGDYHLQSITGRWDPTLSDWVTDDVTSRCIGAANPGRPGNTRLNLGAYSETEQFSFMPNGWSLAGDLTNDGVVDALDMTAFNELKNNPLAIAAYQGFNPADLNHDSQVDNADQQILQGQMEQMTVWYVPGQLNNQWAQPPGTPQENNGSGSVGGGR